MLLRPERHDEWAVIYSDGRDSEAWSDSVSVMEDDLEPKIEQQLPEVSVRDLRKKLVE